MKFNANIILILFFVLQQINAQYCDYGYSFVCKSTEDPPMEECQCQPCPSNCAACFDDSRVCYGCVPDAILSNGVCVVRPPNCDIFIGDAGRAVCTKCAPNSCLYNGACVPECRCPSNTIQIGAECKEISQITQPVYRWHNAKTIDHFLTLDSNGEDLYNSGYRFERVEFCILQPHLTHTIPLLRYWIGGAQTDHFYTTDANEGASVVKGGYKAEGNIGYVYQRNDIADTTPLYRYFSAAGWDHFYTIDKLSDAYLKAVGYKYEGIQGYVFHPSKC